MKQATLIILFSITVLFAQQSNLNLIKYVNPFIGTANHGHVYPGATVPFGMVQLSPDNGRGGWDWCSGYNYSDSLIAGFSHTHLSGTGIGDLCDISFMPGLLPKNFDESQLSVKTFTSKFSHKNEKAEPGYYSVTLENKIKVQLTAALRTGIQKYSFPRNDDAYVKLDLGFAINWDSPVETFIKIESSTRIVGYRLSKGWAEDQRIYFVSEFSKPFTVSWLGDNKTLEKAAIEIKAAKAVGVFKFDAKEILIKTGISSTSIENAKANLAADIKNFNFDSIRKNAVSLWNKELGKLEVESKDKNLLTIFYTSLYRTMLAPVVFSDATGSYKGPDGNIHSSKDFTRYTIFSLWDTFRAAHPLFTLTQPERIKDLINSIMAHYKEYGLLPVWELHGNETNCMIGYHAIPVLADAVLKGFSGFDVNEVYTAMKISSMQDQFGLKYYRDYGYIPADKENESVSRTLEYAYDDWCIAQVAKHLGNTEDYKYYLSRSEYYKNLFDPVNKFMRGKMSDGKWRTPFNPKRSDHNAHDYTEGNAWQYSWFVPHDVQGFINLFGSRESFIEKLDSLFSIDSKVEGDNASPDISGMIGQYAHGNEPSHHVAYLYNYVGESWKTQMRVNQILRTLYNNSPEGLCGNEDCGQMSAWYVLSAMGLYQANPAEPNFLIGSPLLASTKLFLGKGKAFTIEAKNLSGKNIYVQAAQLNGKPLKRSFITFKEITDGGKLILKMGPKPNKELWTKDEAVPPSQTKIIDPGKIDKAGYAEKIKQMFLHGWKAYKKYAWGKDQLKPVSKIGENWYSESFLLTPVDAFTTMKLMGLKEEAEEAKRLILNNLSFDKNIFVRHFEFTIRLLGGLISAYQLDGDSKFLELAEDLGKRFLNGFNSKTGMPYRWVNLQTGEVKDKISNPAEIGTLMVEFGSLSKLTGNSVYYETAKKAFVECYNRHSAIGLPGTQIDVETGEWKNSESHIGAMIDSYFEYMIKCYHLFGDKDFKEMYDKSMYAVNKYMWDSTTTGYWYKRVDMNTGQETRTIFGALDAFVPAMLVLGEDYSRAIKLQESCYKMWTQFGIEPEEMNYKTFEVHYPNYPLRPEIVESAFYLYRHAKNPRYLEMGKTFYDSFEQYCKLDEGYAPLKNVLSKEKEDPMESFFFAETLKYLYLLFAPDETLDLSKYVFNTEAHPIKKFTN